MRSYSKFFAWGGLELFRSGFGLHPRWVGLFLRLARFMAVDDGWMCLCGCLCVGVVTFIDREYYYDMFVSITITIITARTSVGARSASPVRHCGLTTVHKHATPAARLHLLIPRPRPAHAHT